MSNDLVDAAERLAELLAQENEALGRLDFAAAVALLPAKETALVELTKQPPLDGVPTPALTTLQRRLIGLAKDNQGLLERAIAAQTRVVRIVARACTALPAVARYGTQAKPVLSDRAAAMALSTRA